MPKVHEFGVKSMADLIQDDEIKRTLARSGYLIERRVSQELEKRQWQQVVPNYAYLDPGTGDTRELDVLAIQTHQLDDHLGEVRAVMLAECVNNPQPFTVFNRPAEYGGAADVYAIRMGGNLQYMLQGDNGHWEQTLAAADARHWHHCCGESFSTQFCSFRKKGSGSHASWMAEHESSHFGCFVALYQAMKHLRQYHVKGIRSGRIGSSVRLDLYYPCLILQQELINVGVVDDNLTIDRIPRALYQRGLIEEGINDVLFSDILLQDELGSYGEMIEGELQQLASFLNHNTALVQTSLAELKEKIQTHLNDRAVAVASDIEPPPWPPFAT